jgi:AcrR family transcriptional regulator
MAEATPEQPDRRELPPGLDLLWGRRERGKRGPRPGLSADAIVEAAIRVADAAGLEAVSMARVAAELGRTTMSLYRYVDSKDELLQLMWNASALGAEELVIEGDGWRERLRTWALIQWEMLGRHPWITQMPMAAPPVAPNSLHFVERGLQTMDDTGLTDGDKLQVIGLISSYTLSEARMAADGARAAAAAAKEAGAGNTAETGPAETQPQSDYGELLRELLDERTYPRLYRFAWGPDRDEAGQSSEQYSFLFGLDVILDGAQALIDRGGSRSGSPAAPGG